MICSRPSSRVPGSAGRRPGARCRGTAGSGCCSAPGEPGWALAAALAARLGVPLHARPAGSEVAHEPGQGRTDVVHAVIPAVDEIGRRGGLGDNEEHDEDDDPKSDDPPQHPAAPWRRKCCRSSPPNAEAAQKASMLATYGRLGPAGINPQVESGRGICPPGGWNDSADPPGG
jgi:hypothetical protein